MSTGPALRPGRLTPPNVCTVLLLLLFLAIWLRPLADLDFAWQIRTGGLIIEDRNLHVEDSFTYTIAGKRLPDFEWLYEVFLWGVWSLAGYGGLHLMKLLCVLAPLVILAWRLRRESVGWHMVYVSVIIAILVFIPAWNLRPFYLTTIGLLLLSGWLRDHCAGRRSLSWETPLLMLIWGNSHPGVITGQGLLLGAISWEWLNRWVKLNRPLDRGACVRLTLFGGLGFLASLVCPDPIQRLQYTFDPGLRHPIMRGFVEIMPLHWYALRPPFLASLIYPVALLVLVTVVKDFRRYRLWELALLGGVALLGSYAYRAAQDFLLIFLAVGVPHLVALYRGAAPRNVPKRLWRVERSAKRVIASPHFRFQPGWALGMLVLIGLLSLSGVADPSPRRHGKDWPVKAVDTIDREKWHGNYFADPNRGTYLVWRLGPEKVRCYADTRGFYFPPETLENCVYVLRLEGDWQERLMTVLESGTDYFLVPTGGSDGVFFQRMAQFVQPLYRDDTVAILDAKAVRRGIPRLTSEK